MKTNFKLFLPFILLGLFIPKVMFATGNECAAPFVLTLTGPQTLTHQVENEDSTIWLKFTAPFSSFYFENILDMPNNLKIKSFEIFNGSCLSNTSIFSSRYGISRDSIPLDLLTGLTIDDDYLILIKTYGNGELSIKFDNSFDLSKIISSPCNAVACGPELVENGDFENSINVPFNSIAFCTY